MSLYYCPINKCVWNLYRLCYLSCPTNFFFGCFSFCQCPAQSRFSDNSVFFVLSFLLSCDYCLNFPDSSFEVFTLKNLAWRSTVAPDTASLDAVWSPMPEQKFPWHALCRTYGRWENWSLPPHQPQRDISKYDDWINTCASSCYKACQSLAHWAPSYKRLKVINV